MGLRTVGTCVGDLPEAAGGAEGWPCRGPGGADCCGGHLLDLWGAGARQPGLPQQAGQGGRDDFAAGASVPAYLLDLR